MAMPKKTVFDIITSGFMSPAGDFYEAGYMEHLYVADNIYKSIHGVSCTGDGEEALMNEGWLVIHSMTFLDYGFLFNFNGHLTPEQIRVIKPLVENNWDRVIKSNRTELQLEFYGVCDGMI